MILLPAVLLSNLISYYDIDKWVCKEWSSNDRSLDFIIKKRIEKLELHLKRLNKNILNMDFDVYKHYFISEDI